MLKDGSIGAVAALTVTNTVADAGLALPDPCGVEPVVLGYWAVRLYVPTASDVIDSVATPEEFRPAVPITVEPFMKLTVPTGEVPPLSVTVAVRISAWPSVTGFGDATRLIDVVAVEAVTVTEVAADVLAAKLEVPT
jgi:hypothetical protein